MAFDGREDVCANPPRAGMRFSSAGEPGTASVGHVRYCFRVLGKI